MEASLNEHINAYKRQMEVGHISKAYKGILGYMMQLRTYLQKKYPDNFVVGNFYQGRMDMTYFPFTPISLKRNKLKLGIVFDHEKIQFELWLVGQNKQVQKKYWNYFKAQDWVIYPITRTAQDAIIIYVLIKNPNFDQFGVLTTEIEDKTLKFTSDIEKVIDH